jgi:hypothetical protein
MSDRQNFLEKIAHGLSEIGRLGPHVLAGYQGVSKDRQGAIGPEPESPGPITRTDGASGQCDTAAACRGVS